MIWVQVSADAKRGGELIAHVGQGQEKGKIAFFEKPPEPDPLIDLPIRDCHFPRTGCFCAVEVVERRKRFLRVRPFHVRDEDGRIAQRCRYYGGQLAEAKAEWAKDVRR